MSSTRRWALALAAAGIAVLALVLVPTSAASAHAVFVSADPQPGASLRTSPTSVHIVFSEPLNPSLSSIRLYGSSGHQVRLRSSRVEAGNPRGYLVNLAPLRPDRYTVVWHTVSEIDGHTRRGSYTFTLDRPDGHPPTIRHAAGGLSGPPQVATSAQAAAMWVGLAGLFLLSGSVLMTTLGAGLDVAEIPGVRKCLWWLLIGGAGFLLAGTAGQLISAWAPSGWTGASLRSILTSSVGRWWEIRLAATAAVLGLWVVAARLGGRELHYASGVVAGVVAFSFAATAHGAASALPSLGLGFEFVHVLASSAWLGGALAMVGIWVVFRRSGDEARRTLLHRYSIIAGVAVPAVLASGLGNTVVELGGVHDLVRYPYGASLLIKLIAVVVLLGVAALNATVLRLGWRAGKPRGQWLSRTIAIEAAIGLAVLVPTAVMGVLAPTRPLDQARSSAHQLAAQSDPAHAFSGSTDLQGRGVEISLNPGAVGVNAVRVEVDGAHAVSTLRISISGPGTTHAVDLARTGYDHDPATHTIYRGSLRIEQSGTWKAVLSRTDGAAAGVAVVMPVTPPLAGRPAQASLSHLVPWLELIALAGLGVMVAAAARALSSRRSRVGVLALGGTALTAAIAWTGALTLGAAGPAAPSTNWGHARVVHPTQMPQARVWQMPTRGAGLMTPAIAPDGSVWVAEMNSDKLARLDPRTNVVREFTFPDGTYQETMGIAVAADGRVWIAQEHAMALGMFDPDAGRYREFRIPGGVSAPVGIAIDPHGNVWFTEMSGNKIGSFDPSTLTFRQYPIPTGDATPYWLALAPDGRVWFTEFRSGRVGVLNPKTGHIREYAVPGHPNIPGIDVGRHGAVWFTTLQGSLFRLTPTNAQFKRIPLPAGGDYGVTAAPDGTVWVGRQGGRDVYAVQPTTEEVRSYQLPTRSAPWWPTTDRAGHVWVGLASDSGNGLAELRGR